ncbi:SDR family oxidoreductase [Streptomyces sp. NPDC001691]|uniref:SDR family oxidoreductase n=1 Tax=Streptomyces sp. NPDC001691 TaxID=3364600 RepID=UPI0036A6BAC8
MRIFVTGASGWIGSALVPELIAAGHRVVGLARSDVSAAALNAAGVEVHRGTLGDLDGLSGAAAASDGVIHLAFNHDIAFTGDFAGAVQEDRRAVEAFGDALAGSGKPLVLASGLVGLVPGRMSTEQDGHDIDLRSTADLDAGPRGRQVTAELTLALAARDIRSSVLRLPPTVYGPGDRGFMAALIAIAKGKGVSGYIGDGTARWPAVHRLDAAHLFRLAVESAPAGSTLHAVNDEGVPLRTVAELIGRHLDLPVVSVAPEDAGTHFGWLGAVLSLDSPASSTLTRELLDWQPTHPGLIDDLEKGHYFHADR